MATARVEVDVTTKGTESLKTAASGLEGVGDAAKKADQELNAWTNTQQKAAQRMEAMHEDALKMNQGFKSASDEAEQFSSTIGQASAAMGKYSASASQVSAAFGVQTSALSNLDGVTQVASLSWNQLSTSVVGFNAASVTAAAGGAALGAMIGAFIRDLPGVADWTNKWADNLYYLATGMTNAERAGKDLTTSAGKTNEQVQKNVRALLGSDKAYAEHYKKPAEGTSWLDKALKTDEERSAARTKAAKTAADADREAFENGTRLATNYAESEKKAAEQMAELAKQAKETDHQLTMAIAKSTAPGRKLDDDFQKGQVARADLYSKQLLKNIKDQQKAEEEAGKSRQERLQELAQKFGDASKLATGLGDALVAMGVKGDSALVKMVDTASEVSNAIGGVIQGFASGGLLGGITAGVAGVAGIFGKLFGKGKREREEAAHMREDFIASAGGLDALNESAKHAGVSLDKVFDSKKPKDMAKAIDAVNAALDLTAQAEEELNSAMERYGITVDEMGPKFAQQNLDKQAVQLFSDYQMLTAAGADHNAMLEKMAPTMNEYINAAVNAGATVPMNLKPMVDGMAEMGLLTNEAGESFDSAAAAGITFGATLEESMASVATSIERLVAEIERLYGLGPINIPVNVGGVAGVGAAAGGGGVGTNLPGAAGEIPQFAGGGPVSHTGLAYVHAGEYVSKPGERRGGGGMTTTVNVSLDSTAIVREREAFMRSVEASIAKGVELGNSPVNRALGYRYGMGRN